MEKREWNDNMTDDCVDLMIAYSASLVTDYKGGWGAGGGAFSSLHPWKTRIWIVEIAETALE